MNKWNSSFKVKPTKPLKRSKLRRGTKKLAKVRKDTVGKLKLKLWALCRAIIIQRYANPVTGENTCYSCNTFPLVGSNRHLGHFIPSSVCSAEMRYSLDNLRVQCYRCNIHLSGNWIAYEAHLRLDGIDVEELKRRNEATKGKKYDILFYQAKIAEYELELLKS